MRILLLIFVLCGLSAAFPVAARAQQTEDSYLLHVPVDPALFSRFRIWDDAKDEWRAARAQEQPAQQAAVVVLHLWADYCAPCRAEFPLLRDLTDQLSKQAHGRLQFVYLSETAGSVEAATFFAQNRDRMPRGAHYQDTGEAIASLLRQTLPAGQLTLPLTLLLDEQRIIRQAFIGSIAATAQRGALVAGIQRLLRLTQAHPSTSQPAGRRVPK